MNFSWPHRAARGWAVGIAAVAATGAMAMVAPAMASTHAVRHATTTKFSAVSGTVGRRLTLTAKVTGSAPKGTVKFVQGGKTVCSASLSNGTARCGHTWSGVGSFKVKALYKGNSTHKSSSATATVKVLAIKTSVKVTASPASTTAGMAVTFTAVVTPTTATGTVTFSDAGGRLGSPVKLVSGKATLKYTWAGNGTYNVTAAYNGDAKHAKSSGSTKVTVATPPVNPTTTVVTNNFPITEPVDTPATVDVRVSDDVAGGAAPTGTVLVTTAAPWAYNAGYTGPVQECTAALTPATGLLNGLAYSTGSCTTGGVGWGFIELGAIYTPDSAAFAASNNDGTEVKIINLYPDTTTVTAPAGTAGDPVTLVGTLGGPGGGNVLAASPENDLYGAPANPDTITFTVTDSTGTMVATCDAVPLAGGTTAVANYANCPVTLPAGTYTVTAVFAGDEYAAGSTSAPATLTVS